MSRTPTWPGRTAQAHGNPKLGRHWTLTSSEGDHGRLAFACTGVGCHLHFIQAPRVESGEGQAVLAGWNARDGPVVRGVCDLLEKVAGIRTGILAWSYRWAVGCKESRIEPKRTEEREGEWARLGERWPYRRQTVPAGSGTSILAETSILAGTIKSGSLIPHLMISSKKKLHGEGQKAQLTLLRVSPKTFSLFLKTSLWLLGLLAKIKCKNLPI